MDRISGYELFRVPPRWNFLRIETAEGLVGWGAPGMLRHPRAVQGAVADLIENHLVGEDPGDIERLWKRMYLSSRAGGGQVLMSAMSGIDMALWDIKGKRHGVPAFELMGGAVRDRIEVYQWVGGDRPAVVAEEARTLVDAGYSALKMLPSGGSGVIDDPASVDAAADRVREVREAVGEEVGIAVDFRSLVSRSMTQRLIAALEPYRPMFVEEPVLPENNEHLPRLARRTDIPIATGERLFSRWEFKPILKGSAVDVVQPSIHESGGITEVRKIGTMAETNGVVLSPNCAQDPISLAACLQVDACATNAVIQPQYLDLQVSGTDDALTYLDGSGGFDFEDGYLAIPDDPGLGIEVDESHVREQADADVDWRDPVSGRSEGTLIEW